MDPWADENYFFREAEAIKQLAELKDHRQPSVEAALLLAKYLETVKTEKDYMEKAIHELGEAGLHGLLNEAGLADFSSLGDSACIELFGLFIKALLHNHLEPIRAWMTKTFSPLLWLSLSKLYLKSLFSTYPKFVSDYQMIIKTEQSKEDLKAANFLNRCLLLFNEKLASLSFDLVESELLLCEKVLEFLVVCVSTPQSRLATIQLMQDRQFYIITKMFQRYLTVKYLESGQEKTFNNLDRLIRLLKRFVNFDIMGESRIAKRTILVHYDTFQDFQKLLFHHFSEKVEHYVIKSVGSADTREKLMEIFTYLDNADLRLIANKLNIFVPEDRHDDPVLSILTEEKGFKVVVEEILIFKLKARKSMLDKIKSLPLYPTQLDLWSEESGRLRRSISRSSTGESFAVDRVTNSFINLEDYLIRYFHLWKQAFALESSSLIEQTSQKLHPSFEFATGQVQEFKGWSPDSVEVKEFTIFEVEKPQIGKLAPENILAEVVYSTVEISTVCKQAWERLLAQDSLFLLSFRQKSNLGSKIVNELDPLHVDESRLTLSQVRGCELLSHMDEDRSKINITDFRTSRDIKAKGTKRYLQLHLDPHQYALDMKGSSEAGAARNSAFNVVVKRHVGSPNFKVFLSLITRFLEHHFELADWVTAGIVGKPSSNKDALAKASSADPVCVDAYFADREQFASAIQQSAALQQVRRLFADFDHANAQRLKKSCSLTTEQAVAAAAASLPGFTLIDGAPNTGKLTVVAALIAQMLHNQPEDRVLVVTRTSSSISRLLEKLAGSLTEDELIRLDSRSTHVAQEKDFTKFGRVNFMLKQRLELLEQVEAIAADVGLSLHSQLTCETADILFKSQILSRWQLFLSDGQTKNANSALRISSYPFRKMI